jgi:LL-H family phage holin
MLNEFIAQYGMEIISTVLVAIVGFIGAAVKNIYQKYVDDATKEKVVKTVVKAVKQLYGDLEGEEKLTKAIESITEMLNEKGIAITELEIRMLIEASVAELKESTKEGSAI